MDTEESHVIKRFSLQKRASLVTAIYVIAASLAVSTFVEKQSLKVTKNHLSMSVTEQANSLRARIEGAIVNDMTTIESFSTILAVTPYLSQQRYSSLLSKFLYSKSGFKNIAAAPNLIVKYVYPLNGNESVIGLNYQNIPSQRDAVNRIQHIIGSLLIGPIDLVQGGRGMIVRAPVNRDVPYRDAPEFWGIVSGVIDLEYFFEKTDLNLAAEDLDISIRWNSERDNTVFFGDSQIFKDNPLTFPINFPNGQWQMAVLPKGGWPQYSENILTNRIWIFFIGFFVFVNALFAVHFLERKIKAEKTLHHALEAIDEGFVLCDKSDRIEVFNSKYSEICDKSREMIKVGMPLRDIIRHGVENHQFPDSVGREEEFISERMALHLAANSTIEQRVAGGRWLRIEERKTSDGGIVGIRMDITELKNTKEAAERANAAKTTFLNIVSHELRTPLTVILGYTPLLAMLERLPSFIKFRDALEQDNPDILKLREAAEDVLQEVLEYTNRIDESGKRLLAIIDDIIALSKDTSEGQAIVTRNIHDFLQEIKTEFGPAADDKGLKLSVQCDRVYISTNFDHVTKVLNSLICNAIKFTDEGTIDVSVNKEGETTVFRISDTGKGIPESELENIFNAFTQVDSSDVREHGGAGLGLAIVRKLVQQLGGEYGVTSKVGQGSTFWFSIPNQKGNVN